MKKHFKRIICVVIVVLTLALTCSVALASNDTYPYQGWNQFRVLKDGKSGHDVRFLQQYLLMTGNAPGSVDGSFGSNTEAAVIRYQRSHPGLTIDGIVGANTGTRMRNNTAQYDEGTSHYSYMSMEATSTWSWQDRFWHYSNGAWKVCYGNTPTSWSSPVTAWQP